MAVTTITRAENRGSAAVALLNSEDPGGEVSLAPGASVPVNVNVPWATSAEEFGEHHLEVKVAGAPRFWIWQALRAGVDCVRFSTDGAWHDPGDRVHGLPLVGGDRTIVVQDGCFELVDFPQGLLAAIGAVASLAPAYALCPTQPPDRRPSPPASVPKLSAVAFSMAGPPSDAFDRHVPGARLLYRDSGKRYEFRVVNGVVHAYHPDGTDTALTAAVSYSRRRAGESTPSQITLPPIDLIAANGGRVFAKAQGRDAFYFALMDHMFIGADEHGQELVVPSTYYKLDPEYHQAGATSADLTAHFRGCFAEHPAAERFPLFRLLLEQQLLDMMLVAMRRRVWHLIDARPPVAAIEAQELAVEIARQVLAIVPVQLWLAALPLAPFLDAINTALADLQARLEQARIDLESSTPTLFAPPDWVSGQPGHPVADPYVAYCEGGRTKTLTAVRYYKVLDIGVGHVHWHEQYERVTGGEIQRMRAGALSPDLLHANYAYLYRFANGPVRDGDGYIDGTCNFYALVQLLDDATISADPRCRASSGAGVPDSYAVLYVDEQSYATQRWRLVHPDDHRDMSFSLVGDLDADLGRQSPLYNWHPTSYWCPFRAGLIGRRGRMAVSRQVILVTGEDASGTAVLYSINFSFSTMDRTWRWRSLPAPAAYFASDAAAGAEQIPTTGGACVYPETVRLREDMTIHLKGRRLRADNTAEVGRWYQRYLPASNAPVPPAEELVPAARPPRGYTHAWKFLPETVFRNADKFSHFGVYDTVDSRTQYYPVTPADANAAATLAATGPGPWVDVDGALFVRAWKFWWAAPLRPPDVALDLIIGEGRPEKRPPSIFNPDTRLRIEQRGGQWVALHWDKRDDDLMPFDGLPMPVTLQNGTAQARVTLQPNIWMEGPPVVHRAAFIWPATSSAPITLELASSTAVWRVRMAALDASRPGGVVSLLDVETEGRFTPTAEGLHVYRWTPTPAQLTDLQRYCSSRTVAQQYATSIWCVDLVGHVSVPEEVHWLRTMRVTVSPAALPLGLPVRVTVYAADAATGASLTGSVTIDGQAVGSTGTAFTYTFIRRVERIFDPDTRTWTTVTTDPSGSVAVRDYHDADIPFNYYVPQLRIQVQPTAIAIGRPTQVTVQAVDTRTGAAVAGRVLIGGQDVGPTNTPFTYSFTAGATGVVTAGGYPNASVTFPLYTPQLRVWVDPTVLLVGLPQSITIHAVDANTNAPVAGRVLINGQDLAATGTPFAYTFAASPPAGLVRSPQYPDAAIPWPPLHQPQLVVAIQPYPVPLDTTATVTVHAEDAYTHAAVDGAVKINGQQVARTNLPFSYRFVMQTTRTFDPNTGEWEIELTAPIGTVSAPNYPDASIDLGV
jgi:hypothetical protein